MTMAGGIQIGRRDTRGASVVVVGAGVTSPIAGHADYTAGGTADEVTIALALADLTSSRTWIETVKLIGGFTLADEIVLSSYTRLDATEAALTLIGGVTKKMLVNENQTDGGGDTNIEIFGGIWTGNYGDSNNGVKDALGFIEVDGWKVIGSQITKAAGTGLFIRGNVTGGSGQTNPGLIDDVDTYSNGQSGTRILSAARLVMINSLRSRDNNEDGVSFQSSEVNAALLTLKGNGRYNFNTENIHSSNFRGVTSIDAGLHGVRFNGVVDSYFQGTSRTSCKGTVSVAFTSGGTIHPREGQTLTGATSSATMILVWVNLTSGSWAGGDAAGTFYGWKKTGTFQSENLDRGSDTNVATIAGDTTSTANTFDDVIFADGNTKGYGDNRHLLVDIEAGQGTRGRDNGETPDARWAVNFSDGVVENIGGTFRTMANQTGEVNWPPEAQRLAFTSGGTFEILAGATITGATSSATGVVTSIYHDQGTWAGGDEIGVLWIKTKTGVFQSENLDVGGNLNVATIAGDSTPTKLGLTHSRMDDSLDLRAAIRVKVTIPITNDDTALTTGDGKVHYTVHEDLNGMNLVKPSMSGSTASTSGIPTVQIRNVTDSVDMLTTKLTVDQDEKHSSTAATVVLVNTDNDDVVTGDEIAIDVDVAGTGFKGAAVDLVFQLPI